jgi:hypothetical protein
MTIRRFRFAMTCAVASAGLALTGCATTAGPASEQATGPTESDIYVYAVDRAAERQGIRVIWVNPPKGGKAARLGYTLETVDDGNGRP